jgi:hypothetical protein
MILGIVRLNAKSFLKNRASSDVLLLLLYCLGLAWLCSARAAMRQTSEDELLSDHKAAVSERWSRELGECSYCRQGLFLC